MFKKILSIAVFSAISITSVQAHDEWRERRDYREYREYHRREPELRFNLWIEPAPLYVPVPAPVYRVPVVPSNGLFYYCYDPAGYWPQVQYCNTGWVTVRP